MTTKLQTLQNIRNIPAKAGMGHQNESSFRFARTAVIAALKHVDSSRQMCVQAGQLLRELKASIDHGDFTALLEQYIPEISEQTARTWMRAAESVTKALKFPDSIEIDSVVTPLSEIIGADRSKLTKQAQALAQQWFNFTEGKTIKDCIAGVVVDGDDAHRIDRAINGKTKGGAGGDRKDFPTFIGRKLSQLTTHLEHYKKFSAPQLERTELLTRQVVKKWPSGYLELLQKEIKEELKTR